MALQPLHLEETWTVRDAAPNGRAAEQMFAILGRHVEGVDVLSLNRPDGDPIIVLPWCFWKRVLLTVVSASGESPSKWTGG